MRVDEPWLGEKQVAKEPKAPFPSARSQFSDPTYDSIKAADDLLVKPEHRKAVERAQEPLYGGLAGIRCDPVEEFPGDADEPYGIPKAVQPLGVPYRDLDGDGHRDDEPPKIADKPASTTRHIAASDISGAGDRIAEDKDFAQRNQPDRDPRRTRHH